MREEQGTGKKQILVVEDESLIAADPQKHLEKMGYSAPAVAHSGDEALGCARKTPFNLVHDYLEREGFQLLNASNAEDAESVAAAWRHAIDLLVADILMPARRGSGARSPAGPRGSRR